MSPRVRVLNVWGQTVGIPTPFLPPTAAWDLETDLEPRFAKPYPVHLQQQALVFVPPPVVIPSGWTATFDTRSIPPKLAARMDFLSYVAVPYVVVATSAASGIGSTTLTFTSVPAAVVVGMFVIDITTPPAIVPNTTVLSKTSTTVSISNPISGVSGVGSGDLIRFSY